MAEKLTDERREELRTKIRWMMNASDTFYKLAVQAGVHPFIEFCGFMNEYIKLCETALDQGIDFTECHGHSGEVLPMMGYHASYLGEKFNCVFGPSMRSDDRLWSAFVAQMKEDK